MINQDHLKELRTRIDAIGEYLKINDKRLQLQEDELQTQDPEFLEQSKRSRGFNEISSF